MREDWAGGIVASMRHAAILLLALGACGSPTAPAAVDQGGPVVTGSYALAAPLLLHDWAEPVGCPGVSGPGAAPTGETLTLDRLGVWLYPYGDGHFSMATSRQPEHDGSVTCGGHTYVRGVDLGWHGVGDSVAVLYDEQGDETVILWLEVTEIVRDTVTAFTAHMVTDSGRPDTTLLYTARLERTGDS